VNNASGSVPDADSVDEQIDVPLVLGLLADAAAEILRNVGLQPVVHGRARPAPDDLSAKSSGSQIVTAQRPAARRVAAGSEIELWAEFRLN
jgi:hypothetical protein